MFSLNTYNRKKDPLLFNLGILNLNFEQYITKICSTVKSYLLNASVYIAI